MGFERNADLPSRSAGRGFSALENQLQEITQSAASLGSDHGQTTDLAFELLHSAGLV